MKKLIPVILFVLGSAAGVGAGIFLRPPAVEKQEASVEEAVAEEERTSEKPEQEEPKEDVPEDGFEYVKLTNQFVIPIINEERIASMVVAALSLEVSLGTAEEVLDMEPKLRNEFLRVMFDHANVGGFDGNFTEARRLEALQVALREAAQTAVGNTINDVLIFEIARQDY